MKQSKIVQVVALAIMGLSGHAMASPTVGATTEAKATVEFANVLVTAHTLTDTKGLKPGKQSGYPILAKGKVTTSGNADIAIQPQRSGGDVYTSTDYAKFKMIGKNNPANVIAVYLGKTSGGNRLLEVAGLTDWYGLGTGISSGDYVIEPWASGATINADVYPVTINAAIYTP